MTAHLMTAPEDQFTFSQEAVKCLRGMGMHAFSNPLASYPWGGRPHVLGLRHVYQKYLSNEDIIRAHWVQQQSERADPDWRSKEPGLSFLSALLRERTVDWQGEAEAFAKSIPTAMEYAFAEWGDPADVASDVAAREHEADVAARRASMRSI